jgi:hypothetical protein
MAQDFLNTRLDLYSVLVDTSQKQRTFVSFGAFVAVISSAPVDNVK